MRQQNTSEMSVSILDSINKSNISMLKTAKDTNTAVLGLLGITEKHLQETKKTNETLLSVLNTQKTSSTKSTSTKLEVLALEHNKLLSELLLIEKEKSKNNTKNSGKDLKDTFAGFGAMAGALALLMTTANTVSPKASNNITQTLTSLINGLQPVMNKQKQIQDTAQTLLILSGAISGFGRALAFSTPLYLIGTVGAGLAALNISILNMVMSRIDHKAVRESSQSVMYMGRSILALGLSIAAFAFLVEPQDALLASLSILAVSGAFYVLGAASKAIKAGANSLQTAGFSILMLGLGMAAFNLLVPNVSTIITTSLSILAIGGAFYLLGKGSEEIVEGGLAIGLTALSIGFLGLSIGFFQSQNIGFETIAVLGLSIVTVGAAMYLAGQFAPNIILGAISMSLAALPVYLIANSLKTFQDNQISLETIGIMGASLLAVGTGMTLAGVAAPLIILGSVGMILAGAAISSITQGLSDFKTLNFTEDDSKNLNFAMSSVRVAFMGGDGAEGGILSSLGGFFSSIFDGGAMIANAGSMVIAGAAISSISMGLTDFKKVSWTEENSQTLTSVFSSIIKSFSLISDKKLQAEYGIDITPYDIYLGVQSLSSAGNTITSLAKGVQSFANLTFDEYTYDKASQKLVVSGKTKLSDNDIVNAGNNISKVISVVGKSFAEVGRLDRGENSENSILASIFGGGYVSIGVSSLASSGKTIAELAQGVKDFANLTFTEYEVKDGKITPKAVRKLSDNDIEMATTNISRVVSTVGNVFAEVGKLDAGESSDNGLLASIFGGGGQFVRRGVEALSGAGKLVVDLGQGVKDFANLTLTEYQVQDVNGVPTIVPVSVKTMTDNDFVSATTNISRVVSTVAKVFADVGKLDAGETTDNNILNQIFGSGLVKSGVEALSGVGGNLIAIADAIPKYANLSFTKMAIKDVNGVPTVVPDQIITLSEADLQKSSENISKILGLVAASFSEVGKMAVEGSGWFADGYITEGVNALQGVGQNLSGIVDSVLKVAAMQIPVYNTDGTIASYTKITEEDLVVASGNISKILQMTAKTLYEFGSEYGESGDKYESLQGGIKLIKEVSSSYGQAVTNFTDKMTESANIEATITSFSNGVKYLTTSMLDIFDTNKDKMIFEKVQLFGLFVTNSLNLARTANDFVSIANSFDKMSNSMKVFTESINSLDLKKTELTSSIFSSLAALAGVQGGIENLAGTLNTSIQESFDKMVALLESLNGSSKAQIQSTENVSNSISNMIPALTNNSTNTQTPTTTNPTTNPQNNQQQQPQMNAKMLQDIDTTLRSILGAINRALTENRR